MELRFAFVANSAEVSADGRFFVLGGGIDGIEVREIPTTLPALAVVFRIHFLQDECGHEYRIGLYMACPDGTASPFQTGLVVTPTAIIDGHQNRGANADVAFNLFGIPLPQEGEYSFHFRVDDTDIGSQPLFVRAIGAERQGGA